MSPPLEARAHKPTSTLGSYNLVLGPNRSGDSRNYAVCFVGLLEVAGRTGFQVLRVPSLLRLVSARVDV